MATPDSSTELRHAVDTVAATCHEAAFHLLDLYRVHAHRARVCAQSRTRAQHLAADLDRFIAELNRPPEPRPNRPLAPSPPNGATG